MATSKEEIGFWVRGAKASGARWLLIVCDTFDYEDYPVKIKAEENFWIRYKEYNMENMQRVMEVYDLEMDLKSQLAEKRAWHLPAR
jgi:hypothetical protein